MEFSDVVTDVFLGGVAEELQLGPVGPEDGAIRTHPVQPDVGVVEEVREVLLAAPDAGEGPPLLEHERGLVGGHAEHQPVRRGGEVALRRGDDEQAAVASVAEGRSHGPERARTQRVGELGGVGLGVPEQRREARVDSRDLVRRHWAVRGADRFEARVATERVDADRDQVEVQHAAEHAAQPFGDLFRSAFAPSGGQRRQSRQLPHAVAKRLDVVGVGLHRRSLG